MSLPPGVPSFELDGKILVLFQPILPHGKRTPWTRFIPPEDWEKLQKIFQQLADLYPQLKDIATKNKKEPLDKCCQEIKEYALTHIPKVDDEEISDTVISFLSSGLRDLLISKYGKKKNITWEYIVKMYRLTRTGQLPYEQTQVPTPDLWAIILCGYVIISDPALARSVELIDKGDFYEAISTALYHQFRDKLSQGAFYIPPREKWPQADLTTASQKLKALAQLKPDPLDIEPYLADKDLLEWQEHMSRAVMEMSDLTADVLDVLSAVWLRQADHWESMVWFKADDFLQYRGLKPQKSGSGRRGGYKDERRKEIAKQIGILSNAWITVREMEVTAVSRGRRTRTTWAGESRAVVVSSRYGQRTLGGSLDAYAWRGRPGDVFAKWLFGPGRQTALISQKALHYDPYRQKWEKRLTRYLSYQWRVRQSHGDYPGPFSIQTLLNAIGMKVDKSHPGETRNRLEKALDTLQEDGVIAGWQYEQTNEDEWERRGGWKGWLNWKVLIEPPPQIVEQYAKIKRVAYAPALPKPDAHPIKQARQERRLTLMQAAEEIGISASRLSRIERGEKPSPTTRKKLERWLSKKS